MSISLADQITCVTREIAMRRRVYPNWVARGRMKQSAADLEIQRMEAVLDTLASLDPDAVQSPTLFSLIQKGGEE